MGVMVLAADREADDEMAISASVDSITSSRNLTTFSKESETIWYLTIGYIHIYVYITVLFSCGRVKVI